MINPDYPTSMKFAEGDRYFEVGVNDPEAFLSDSLLSQSQRFSEIDYLESMGINAIYFGLVNACPGDNFANNILRVDPWLGTECPPDFSQFDTDAFHKWEEVLNYLQERNIVVHLAFYLDQVNEIIENISIEEENRFFKYVVARFSSYPNLIWVLAEEYQELFDTNWALDKAQIIKDADPYNHILTITQAPQATFDFAGETNFDLASLQHDSLDFNGLNQMAITTRQQIVQSGRIIPVSISEWPDITLQNRNETRRAIWATIMGGSHFQLLTLFENNTDRFSNWQPIFEDAFKLRQFIENSQYYKMQPHNELVTTGFCLAQPGLEYLTYTPLGQSFQIDLTQELDLPTAQFFNPITGEYLPEFDLPKGKWVIIEPPLADDYAMLITISTDTIPPVISNIDTVNISTTSTRITWQTDEPTTSQIEYGLTLPLNLAIEDTNFAISHSVILPNLQENMNYTFQIKSQDGRGNLTISPEITFTAGVITEPILSQITVLPDSVTLIPGESYQFTAVGFDQNGDTLAFTPTWSASEGQIMNNGFYTAGDSIGTFQALASANEISGEAVITLVNPIFGEPIRVEVEQLNLSTYRIEQNTHSSNNQMISLKGGSPLETGSANGIFTEVGGNYNINIAYYDENDGNTAELSFTANDSLLDSWLLDDTISGSAGADQSSFRIRTVVRSFSLSNGMPFNITSTESSKEHARIDYIEFIEVQNPASSNQNTNQLMADKADTSDTKLSMVPKEFQLFQNYPNPFNAQTRITFATPQKAAIYLQVYNIKGQLVRNLIANQIYEPGIHNITWDGKNDLGSKVSSGVYLYTLKAEQFRSTRTFMLIK